MDQQYPQTLFEANDIYRRGVEDGVRKSLLALINAPVNRTQFARGIVRNALMKEQHKSQKQGLTK